MGIRLDLQAHFWMGSAITGAMISYGSEPTIAIIGGVVVGVLKEVGDPFIGGQRDVSDALSTSTGSVATGAPQLLIPASAQVLSSLSQWWPF